ncbi:MAG: methyltransferase, partial [Spirochaetales bacterium]|nr:methyltransferase [Spirochaetales bacterium]
TLAKEIDFSDIKTVVDVGCGVGVIGLSLKKKYPEMDITLQDRDALAIEFSKENAGHNKIKGIHYSGNLSLDGIEEGSQDLILSNLPAKAGNTVLQDFITRSLIYLLPEGTCAVVVVATLKDTIQTAIRKTKADIIFTEDTREYSVFHYKENSNSEKPGNAGNNEDLHECYIRDSADFQINKLQYTLITVYNLPGFDTVPYHIETAAQVMEKQPVSGRTLFWNPGQGHLPLIAHLNNPGMITETTLASRDILQLKISRENLLKPFSFDNKEDLSLIHICCPEKLCTGAIHCVPSSNGKNNTYNSIIISLDDSDDSILDSFLPITKSGATLIMTGKSSNIAGAVKN